MAKDLKITITYNREGKLHIETTGTPSLLEIRGAIERARTYYETLDANECIGYIRSELDDIEQSAQISDAADSTPSTEPTK